MGHKGMTLLKSKATFMPNPCLRYLHRIMPHTLFGREDNDGNVCFDHLFMWSILNNVKMDTWSFLARHLLKVGRAQSGTIAVGGLIKAITHFYEYDLDSLEVVRGNTRIGLEPYLAIKMILKEDDIYCLCLHNREHPLLLPEPFAIIM